MTIESDRLKISCCKPNLPIINDTNKKYNVTHFTILNKTVCDIFVKRNITFGQFTDLVADAVKDKYLQSSQLSSLRNDLIFTTLGYRKLQYPRFEFIMLYILKEPIPCDRAIIHLAKLGLGVDLVGRIFGRLTVMECVANRIGGRLAWKCRCSCENEIIVSSDRLKSGNTMSCGCYHKEQLIKSITKHGKHGCIEYEPWKAMLARCYNQNHHKYDIYGGRGIIVCDRWRESFENFYEDMGPRPEGTSIDRKDNDGNYEPGNCRWATAEEQSNNQRRSLRFDDDTSLWVWCNQNNIDRNKARPYFYKGYSKEKILAKLKPINSEL